MPQHTVRRGECLATIALRYGFRKWESIYYAAENEAFRGKRPNPNVIYEGDTLHIPDREQRIVDNLPTDQRHRFQAKSQRWMFRMHIRDEEGNGIENEPYRLEIDGGFRLEGVSGDDGLIETEVPQHAREAKLSFAGEEFAIRLGSLDPVSRVKGIQARLNNLGFGAGPVDGIVGPRTRKAVYRFQLSQGDLKATGDIDDATRARLLSVHDGDERLTPAEEDMSPREAEPLEREEVPPGAAAPGETDFDGEEEGEPWRPARYGYENA